MNKPTILRLLTLMIFCALGAIFHQSACGASSFNSPFRVNYIRPAEEVVKVRDVNLSTNLDFNAGSSVLEPTYGANVRALARIDSLMTAIINDATIELNSISIIGYSSPEGTFKSNEILSKARAESIKNYLAKRYTAIPESKYSVGFGGENWDGLYDMVLNSDTPEKMAVLRIITQVDVMQGREKQLMVLAKGVPYLYMLKNLFPALRKVDLNYSYNVRNFSVSEAAEVYKTNPKALSLAEIFNVASLYPENSEEFRSMMISSAALYPNDNVANINAALATMHTGDLVAASGYLSKVREPLTGDYYNTLGVNEALSDHIDRAISALEKGVEQESADAQYNLLLLRKPEVIKESVRDTVFIRDTLYREVVREVIKKPAQSVSNAPSWALKTNLLYWLALQPNIETEFYFANRWSLNIEYQMAWWSRPAKHQYYQYMHLGVEGRYWFKRDDSFSGHYLGVYAGGGFYDLSMGRANNTYEGYQGEFAVAAGLSYGYAWKLKKNLWMEAGIGFGYVMTEYRRYDYIDTHYCYQSTDKATYVGPTKLRLTLMWRPQPKSKK